MRSSECVKSKSWQNRPKAFFTDATDTIIEVDTLGRKSYEAPEIAVGPVVTVGTEGDATMGPTATTAKRGQKACTRDGVNGNYRTIGKRGAPSRAKARSVPFERTQPRVWDLIQERKSHAHTQHSGLDPVSNSPRPNARLAAYPTSWPGEVALTVRGGKLPQQHILSTGVDHTVTTIRAYAFILLTVEKPRGCRVARTSGGRHTPLTRKAEPTQDKRCTYLPPKLLQPCNPGRNRVNITV